MNNTAPKLPPPPPLRGTPEQKLEQLYRYLFRLAELLNTQAVR